MVSKDPSGVSEPLLHGQEAPEAPETSATEYKRSVFFSGKKRYLGIGCLATACILPIVLAAVGYGGYVWWSSYTPGVEDAYDPQMKAIVENDRMSISWSRGLKETSYTLYQVITPEQRVRGLLGDGPLVELYQGSRTEYVLKHLMMETEYAFQLKVEYMDDVEPAMSSPIKFTTSGPLAPVSPNAPGIDPEKPASVSSIELMWNKPRERGSDLTSYDVEVLPAECETRVGYACDSTQVTMVARYVNLKYDWRKAIGDITDCFKSATIWKAECFIRSCCNLPTPKEGSEDVYEGSKIVNDIKEERYTHSTEDPDSTMTAARAYWFRVRGVAGAGSGNFSDWDIHMSDMVSINVPKEISPPKLDTRKSTPSYSVLKWDMPTLNQASEIRKYVVETDMGKENLKEDEFVPVNVEEGMEFSKCHCNITHAVDKNTKYRYRLTAVNTAGASASSKVVTILSKDFGPPEATDSVFVGDGASDQLTVQWVEPSNGGFDILRYQVQQVALKKGDGCGKNVTVEGNVPFATFQGMKPNQSCGYLVRAENEKGWGPWSKNVTLTTFNTGDCTNGNDLAVILGAAFQSGFHGVMTRCGAAKMGNAAASAACLRKGFPRLSETCSLCFGDSAACGMAHCKSKCWSTPNADDCIQCGIQYCQKAEVVCTGIPKESLPV